MTVRIFELKQFFLHYLKTTFLFKISTKLVGLDFVIKIQHQIYVHILLLSPHNVAKEQR